MPRQARLDSKDSLHHVMIRGINKSDIFRDDRDRSFFLDRLHSNLKDTRCSVHAFALMNNHVHLLFKSGDIGISNVMRKQLSWYAGYFNRKYQRTGHLFENRFKSILVEEDRYFLALVRYINLNPLRTGQVKDLDELDYYPWTSHSVFMGHSQHDLVETSGVFALFDNQEKDARADYRRFMEEGVLQGHIPEFSGGGMLRSQGVWSNVVSLKRKETGLIHDSRILGGKEFLEQVLDDIDENQKRSLKVAPSGRSIIDLVNEQSRKTGIIPAVLCSGSRRSVVSQARKTIAVQCINELGMTYADVARHLGVTTSAITRAVQNSESGDR